MAYGGSARVKSKNAFPQSPIQLAPLSSFLALCGAVLQPFLCEPGHRVPSELIGYTNRAIRPKELPCAALEQLFFLRFALRC